MPDSAYPPPSVRATAASRRRVTSETGTSWVERDVDEDPELLAAYSDQVPVVLVDGEQHDFWRVDEHRLRAALSPGGRWGRRSGR